MRGAKPSSETCGAGPQEKGTTLSRISNERLAKSNLPGPSADLGPARPNQSTMPAMYRAQTGHCLWVTADDRLSLQQPGGRIAHEQLGVPAVDPQHLKRLSAGTGLRRRSRSADGCESLPVG